MNENGKSVSLAKSDISSENQREDFNKLNNPNNYGIPDFSKPMPKERTGLIISGLFLIHIVLPIIVVTMIIAFIISGFKSYLSAKSNMKAIKDTIGTALSVDTDTNVPLRVENDNIEFNASFLYDDGAKLKNIGYSYITFENLDKNPTYSVTYESTEYEIDDTDSVSEFNEDYGYDSNSMFECALTVMDSFTFNGKPVYYVRRESTSNKLMDYDIIQNIGVSNYIHINIKLSYDSEMNFEDIESDEIEKFLLGSVTVS